MNKNILVVGVVLLLSLPAMVLAADVSGKWVGQAAGADITLNFKADGAALTGTLNNSQAPGELPIKEGKIDGDNISFHIVRNMNGTDTKIIWKGKIAGDQINFKREAEGSAGGPGGGGATEVIVKRAK